MKKSNSPNYQMLKDSSISALQLNFSEWKKLQIQLIRYTWYDNEGNLMVPANKESVDSKCRELQKAMERNLEDIAYYNEKIGEKDE